MYKNRLLISKPYWQGVVYLKNEECLLDSFDGDRVTTKGIMRVRAQRWINRESDATYSLRVTFVSHGKLWVISDQPFCDGTLDTWVRHVKAQALRLYREVEK